MSDQQDIEDVANAMLEATKPFNPLCRHVYLSAMLIAGIAMGKAAEYEEETIAQMAFEGARIFSTGYWQERMKKGEEIDPAAALKAVEDMLKGNA